MKVQHRVGARWSVRHRAFALALLLVSAVTCADPAATPIDEEAIRHNTVGTSFLGQQKWAEAEAEFRLALASRPNDPIPRTNIGIALIQRGEIEEAERSLRQALERDSEFASALYNLGLIEDNRGEFARAAEQFERVARQDPEDLHAQYFLGTALARMGREADAERALRAALAIDPGHVSSLYGLGRLLLRAGRDDAGAEMIARSQVIRARSGLDEAVGSQYGEQGRYGIGVDYPGDVVPAPPAIEVTFRVVAEILAGEGAPWTVSVPRWGERPQLFTTAEDGSIAVLSAAGATSNVLPAPTNGRPVALVAGDLDNDGLSDLVGWISNGSSGYPQTALRREGGQLAWTAETVFEDSASLAARSGGARPTLALCDRDHDGDLDLILCWASSPPGCGLATNDGTGRFRLLPSRDHGFELPEGATGPFRIAFSDTDNDRDIDLLVGLASGVRLFSNERDGTFVDVTVQAGLDSGIGDSSNFDIADLDKNGSMDLALGGANGLRIARSRSGRFSAAERPAAERPLTDSAATGVVVFDYDNDGYLDIVTGSTDGAPQLLRSLGASRWSAAGLQLAGAIANSMPLVAMDADADGDSDLVLTSGNRIVLASNEGGNRHRWVALDSRGVGDNRFGIGAKVQVLAGALRQKFEIVRPLPLIAGLGDRSGVDSARYLWPSGVLQDEIRLDSGRRTEIAQLDRKGTSCPLLYVWREGGWKFVTDFLGGSAIGYRHAPDLLSDPDTDEYVRIEPGGLDETDEGHLRVRMNNQLEEVLWFDSAVLVAIDHPSELQVYPNERLMPGPPWPAFRLFASADVRPILAARSVDDGSDLTELLQELDRRYVENFTLVRFKGYATPHSIEIDLGPIDPNELVVLLLDGWIDYADSSANIAARQAGVALAPPTLSVADGNGGWNSVADRMGFPAGLPKTMAVDLSGVLVPSDARLRIATNMRIYWDRAQVMRGDRSPDLRVQRLAPISAELRHGGFPKETSADGRKPQAYDPERTTVAYPWKAHTGAYTTFGDVADLMREIDDQFVVTRNGDEIELVFQSPGPLAPGFLRTFLVFADGFGKDMDPNSAAASEVGPVPFHGMPTYPYGRDARPPSHADTRDRETRIVLPEDDWSGAPPQARAVGDATRRER